MSEGNHKALGFNEPAPVEDVVKFLGEANRNVPVAISTLRFLAGYTDAAWPKDEAGWSMVSSINADSLSEANNPPAVILPINPTPRLQPQQQLITGVYDSHLGE